MNDNACKSIHEWKWKKNIYRRTGRHKSIHFSNFEFLTAPLYCELLTRMQNPRSFRVLGWRKLFFLVDFRDLYGKMMVESTHKYAPTPRVHIYTPPCFSIFGKNYAELSRPVRNCPGTITIGPRYKRVLVYMVSSNVHVPYCTKMWLW